MFLALLVPRPWPLSSERAGKGEQEARWGGGGGERKKGGGMGGERRKVGMGGGERKVCT